MKRHILVIDDDKNMRLALSEALSKSHYMVSLAGSGLEAIKKSKNNHIDVIICDVKLPDIDGISVLDRIKKEKPAIPVILITGYGTIENAVEAMKKGAFDYVLKPFPIESIERIINKALNITIDRGHSKIITQDKKMLDLLNMAKNIAKTKATVFIQGESGTGKELLARYIHNHSQRRDKPFIAVNCAAIPENLLESELFGYEKGAFTGAMKRKLGKFELANHGTLLLDEVTEMKPALQAKLLRVLQESQIDRVGGESSISVDVRIIATTNQDVYKMIEQGKFREDLFFRLNVISLKIPPLRKRPSDIELLSKYFLEKYSTISEKKVTGISEEAIKLLKKRKWKGNVRELENAIERAVLLTQKSVLTPEDFSFDRDICNETIYEPLSSLKEMEKKLIAQALKETGGNRTRAAKILGISVRTLRNKLNEYKDLA